MGGIIDTLFGSEDDSAQNAQLAQNNKVLQLQERLGERARGNALNLFPAADYNRNLGFDAALNAFGQGTGQQLGAFQGGNIGAQNTMLAGLPQQNNAIMGLPTDLSGLQAQQIQYDPSFLQQQTPNYLTTGQVEPGSNQQAGNLSTILAALQGGGTQNSGNFFNQAPNNNTNSTSGNDHGTPASEMSLGNLANAIGTLGGLGTQIGMFGTMPAGTGFAMNAMGNSDLQAAVDSFGGLGVNEQMSGLAGLGPVGVEAIMNVNPNFFNDLGFFMDDDFQFQTPVQQQGFGPGTGTSLGQAMANGYSGFGDPAGFTNDQGIQAAIDAAEAQAAANNNSGGGNAGADNDPSGMGGEDV